METGENNTIINFHDKSFISDLSEEYHLSIQISNSSFTYCILNIKKFHYCLLKSFKIESKFSEISKIISKNPELSLKYSTTSIGLVNFPNTLVPKEISETIDSKEILALNDNVLDVILKDNIKACEITNLYSINSDLNETINNYFPSAKIKSQSSILIDAFLKNIKKDVSVNIYLKDDYMNIIIINDQSPLFQNKFNFSSKEDILYYILFTYQQLELSPEDVPIYLYGSVTDSCFKIIYDYVRNVKYGNKPKEFTYIKEINQLENQEYFALFSQVLCV